MKTLLLTIYFFTIIAISYGQTYHRFLNNVGWCLEEYFGLGSTLAEYENYGDTTINNTNYKILLRDKSILFFVREDTIQKKVWIILPDSSSEYLLYDFSLNIGNQIILNYVNHSPTLYVVDTIDTISTPLGIKKRIILVTNDTTFTPYLHWIEGVGSTYGPIYLFDPTYPNDGFGGSGHCLMCAYQNYGNQSYLGSCALQCSILQPLNKCYSFISSVEEKKYIQSNSLNIYYYAPGILAIENKYIEIDEIKILTILGKEIVNIKNIGQKIVLVNTNKWKSGLYLLKINTYENKPLIKKIIKQ